MGMEETLFYTYVSKLLREAGHMTQATPVYANCSIQTALFIENERPVTLSETDCATLSYVSHVSLLTELTWAGETEKVQLYAVTTDFPKAHRSQDIVETHRLLQGAWRNRHSIVFFQNADAWAVSFADDDMTQVLSDWFPFADEDSAVSARLSIENISLTDSTAYFQDFQYAMARDYYVHPISRTGARYAMLPRDLLQVKYEEDTDILAEAYVSQEEFRSIVHENICYYEYVYGDDYVAPCYTKIEKGKAERKANEAERQARVEAIRQLATAIQQVRLSKQAEEARKAAAVQLAIVLQKITARAEQLEQEEAERQARVEAIRHLATVIQQVRLSKQAEEARKAAIGQLAVVLREIIKEVERQEKKEAERIAREEAEYKARVEEERRAKEEAACKAKERQARAAAMRKLATVIQQVQTLKQAEETKRQVEFERQAKVEAIHQLATAIRQMQLSKQAEEAERIAKERSERIEQLARQHDIAVSRLRQQCRAETELVQAELSSVSARLSQVEQTMARLHFLQFLKKKTLTAERDELLQKQKKLRLLLDRIQDSLQKQLAAEDIAYARALAARHP